MPSAMFTRRNWILRFSIILNVAVILYVGTNIASKNGGDVFIEELQASGRNLASIDNNDVSLTMIDAAAVAAPNTNAPKQNNNVGSISAAVAAAALANLGLQNQINDEFIPKTLDAFSLPSPDVKQEQQSESVSFGTSTASKPLSSSKENGGDVAGSSNTPEVLTPEVNYVGGGDNTPASSSSSSGGQPQQLEDAIQCYDKDTKPRTAQRSEFWVLYNYVSATRKFRCHESITYTTHADYTFLDNLKPLLERWQGPVSLAMHAPGTDFAPTVEAIRYARDCLSPLVSEFVTFHIFFGMRYHVPHDVPRPDKVLQEHANCSLPAPWENVTSAMLYKSKRKILYPVNVGRNVARESATTHYILPSDIELYPSPGVIPQFLAMIRGQDAARRGGKPKVYPLSIFEVAKGHGLPLSKVELAAMMKTGSAIPFHKNLCPGCHNVPKSKEWLAAPQTDGLHVFHVGKRIGHFVHWEPIFIGTHDDPLYDERLSWEGKSDKMTQGYSLCVMDYEFHILDNAFLVHKPGIKMYKRDFTRDMLSSKTNALIRKVIMPELKVLYGTRKGCAV